MGITYFKEPKEPGASTSSELITYDGTTDVT